MSNCRQYCLSWRDLLINIHSFSSLIRLLSGHSAQHHKKCWGCNGDQGKDGFSLHEAHDMGVKACGKTQTLNKNSMCFETSKGNRGEYGKTCYPCLQGQGIPLGKWYLHLRRKFKLVQKVWEIHSRKGIYLNKGLEEKWTLVFSGNQRYSSWLEWKESGGDPWGWYFA